jgi:hypothetical protein
MNRYSIISSGAALTATKWLPCQSAHHDMIPPN